MPFVARFLATLHNCYNFTLFNVQVYLNVVYFDSRSVFTVVYCDWGNLSGKRYRCTAVAESAHWMNQDKKIRQFFVDVFPMKRIELSSQ